ncbi:MAG: sigma-54 dependent transcriptional regulator [Bacteroidales bacterium]|nr:sigma-54 dependent transcriptional regulator [Bacteroidales bacterium]
MQKTGKILVVDDNRDLLKSLKRMLKFDFEEVDAINDPKKLPSSINSKECDVILLDMNFTEGDHSGRDGFKWLKRIKEIDPYLIVILITAYGDIDIAVKAIQEGATSFVTKPWEPQKLIVTIQNAVELSRSNREVNKLKKKSEIINEDNLNRYDPIIGKSKPIQDVLKTIDKIAVTEADVLILGENGTGKELVAREIHKKSNRHNKVFLQVDLSTLNENIFESELFGHVKGAFTDAKEDKTGKFEAASGGTLFLDEIGNLSINLQSKLLAVLQSREITPVGSSKPVKFDIRLICATNKDIRQLVKDQLFREDLFFRINTIEIVSPPLRDRDDDILLLADYFLNKYSTKYNKTGIKLNTKAFDSLKNYKWSGNVRELNHTIEKAVILNEDGIIKHEDLFYNQLSASVSEDIFTLNLDNLERKAIEKALNDSKGNITKASKLLGISRTSLYSKINKHDL